MGPVTEAPAAPPAPRRSAGAACQPAAPVDKRAGRRRSWSSCTGTTSTSRPRQRHRLSRETEEVIADVITSSLSDMAYVVIVSKPARRSIRSARSPGRVPEPRCDRPLRRVDGRRLQDPLVNWSDRSQSLGVGLCQHDMGRKESGSGAEGVVESCVNRVGVDVNTASVPLLRYVSGLNQMVARDRRISKTHGPFTNRDRCCRSAAWARTLHAASLLKIPTGPTRSIAPGFIPKAIRCQVVMSWASQRCSTTGRTCNFVRN